MLNLKPSISHLHHRFVLIIIGFRFLAVRLPQDNVNMDENILVTYASRRTAKPYSIAKTFLKTSRKLKVDHLSCQSQQMIPLSFLIFYLKNYTDCVMSFIKTQEKYRKLPMRQHYLWTSATSGDKSVLLPIDTSTPKSLVSSSHADFLARTIPNLCPSTSDKAFNLSRHGKTHTVTTTINVPIRWSNGKVAVLKCLSLMTYLHP